VSDFLLNILFALVWISLTGNLTLGNLSTGFALGFFILWATRRKGQTAWYHDRIWAIARFLFFFFWELFQANLRLTYDILTPKHRMKPGVVEVPLELTGDTEITILGATITLTPGTLCLEVSEDRRFMYVHGMYIEEREKFIAQIKAVERRVAEVFR
jgi:multicomponent Na+:H+ antiporter subunit E